MHSIVYSVIVEKRVNCYQFAVMLFLERSNYHKSADRVGSSSRLITFLCDGDLGSCVYSINSD